MEMNQSSSSQQEMERPIILSPPALDLHQMANGGMGFHQGRQQSVGYNLQQEFEALNADLDLDLKNKERDNRTNNSSTSSSNTNTGSSGLGKGMMGAGGSKYGFQQDFRVGNGAQNPLLMDKQFNSVPSSASVNNGLGSLMGSGSMNFPPTLSTLPNRPQSVNDFSNFFGSQSQKPQTLETSRSSTFYQDLVVFTNWIENLTANECITAMDHFCNSLQFNTLYLFKVKLDDWMAQQSVSQGQSAPHFDVLSPYQSQGVQRDLFSDIEKLNLNDDGKHSNLSQPPLHQPVPKFNAVRNGHLFVDQKNQRPKSAEPNLFSNMRLNQQQMERTRSPTSHMYEKTNFLQLAAANSPSSQPVGTSASSEDSLDLSAHTALKLGALATINSRVALDSNRKNVNGSHTYHVPQGQNYRPIHTSVGAHVDEAINRNLNSSSVPITGQRHEGLVPSKSPSAKSRKPGEQKNDNGSSSNSAGAQHTSNSSMPGDVSNPEFLNNIPAWLKLLRLHKYTDCLKDFHWKELIELSDEQLEQRGVKALGARRKLLKAFDAVKSRI